MTDTLPSVQEVTDATFGTAVLQESFARPVVVDFWAGWCQPCRMIGPVLERLAAEAGGAFLLAKLDVDANPQMASTFGIRSIPAVKAFRDGRLVDEFVGVIPEEAIRAFLAGVTPSEADLVAEQGGAAESAGRADEAEALYRRAFEMDPNSAGAALGLGRLAAERGDVDAARGFLEPLRPDPEAERLLAAIDVAAWGAGGDGPLAAAERDAASGRFRAALDGFLRLVEAGGDDREPAREGMVKVFAVLGDADSLTREYRARLSRALF